MADIQKKFGFLIIHSRTGMWHRWRLTTFGEQVATGFEKSNHLARVAAAKAKEKYKKSIE